MNYAGRLLPGPLILLDLSSPSADGSSRCCPISFKSSAGSLRSMALKDGGPKRGSVKAEVLVMMKAEV